MLWLKQLCTQNQSVTANGSAIRSLQLLILSLSCCQTFAVLKIFAVDLEIYLILLNYWNPRCLKLSVIKKRNSSCCLQHLNSCLMTHSKNVSHSQRSMRHTLKWTAQLFWDVSELPLWACLTCLLREAIWDTKCVKQWTNSQGEGLIHGPQRGSCEISVNNLTSPHFGLSTFI